jgi:nucleoid-associated protein YgaU
MFLENSRYIQVSQSTVRTHHGREVRALRLRRLPASPGADHIVQGNDRLDVIAQRRYGDSTYFWHIADSNTELYAPDLLRPTLRVIRVPEQ